VTRGKRTERENLTGLGVHYPKKEGRGAQFRHWGVYAQGASESAVRSTEGEWGEREKFKKWEGGRKTGK